MRKTLIAVGATVLCSVSVSAMAVEQDPRVQNELDQIKVHYKKIHPDFTNEDYSRGAYSFDEDKMLQYEAQMEMPPFEDHIEKGMGLWGKPFKNGKTFASCYSAPVAEIKSQFPRWNEATKKVETLEESLNKCRIDNGESKWGYGKGNIAFVSAYLSTEAAGTKINVIVPKGDEKAFKAWNEGKNTYFSKRGQLNLACADCHLYNSGKWIRGQILSTSIGQVTHFPVWRGKWAKGSSNGYGTIQRRYGGCYKQVRANPRKMQSDEMKNLEFFHTSLSNGLDWAGTEYRE